MQFVQCRNRRINDYIREIDNKYLTNNYENTLVTNRTSNGFNFTKRFLLKKIYKANWEDFQDMGNRIHSILWPLQKESGRMNLPIEEYRRIFQYIISNEDPINITKQFIKKYDGSIYLLF